MSPVKPQTRIVEYPFAHLMQGARLDSYEEKEKQILFDVQGLEILNSELFEQDGNIMERATGRHIPLKITFENVVEINHADFFISLAEYSLEDSSRIIGQMHSWVMPGMSDTFHVFNMREPVAANMNFMGNGATYEQGEGGEPFTLERDWSPAPPLPDGVIPRPWDIYDRFGGDPITVTLNGKVIENKLFVGGLENQPESRPPELNFVLNLGERPSNWVKDNKVDPGDRVVEKGEGKKGMSPAEIRDEANWVIDHLKKDESVLVHCVAGMNRSTTICCAVLMLTEGLSAEDALKRVRETHPWAKPDSYHWLALRWLEANKDT